MIGEPSWGYKQGSECEMMLQVGKTERCGQGADKINNEPSDSRLPGSTSDHERVKHEIDLMPSNG
jgi:hypothetical protein